MFRFFFVFFSQKVWITENFFYIMQIDSGLLYILRLLSRNRMKTPSSYVHNIIFHETFPNFLATFFFFIFLTILNAKSLVVCEKSRTFALGNNKQNITTMIKKIELNLNGEFQRWYITNEEEEKNALKAIDAILKSKNITDCTLGSTEDFIAVNALLAEKFNDEFNSLYYVEEYNKWDVYEDVLESMSTHNISDEALISILDSLGWR